MVEEYAPDIALEPEQIGNITISLYAKNLIFDYATLYFLEPSPRLPAWMH